MRELMPLVALLLLCSLALGAAPLFRDTFANGDVRGWTLQPPINARGPIAPNGTWTAEGGAFVAIGSAAPWTVQTAGDPAWSDYRLAVNVTLRTPGPKADYPIFDGEYDRYLPRDWYPPYCEHPGQHRYRFYAGEFDWGSDAAVYLRYQSREQCYRVQLSTEYQEIILWHGLGGYLQVAPCKLDAGKSYKLDIAAQGAHIVVKVDGQPKIDYWHTCQPTLTGGIGLGAYHGVVAFKEVTVTPLPAGGAAPAHAPAFSVRDWRTQRWIFDGNEPITMLEKNHADPKYGGNIFSYCFVKLRPGYRPLYNNAISVIKDNTQTSCLDCEEKDIKVTGGGETLTLQFDETTPDKTMKVHDTDVLTFDRVRGSYRHDMTALVTFVKEQKVSNLEYCDPLTHNNHAPGRGVQYPWLADREQWGVFTGADDKIYRHPISKALLMGEGWYCKPSPSVWMLYPCREICPTWEHLAPVDPHWIIVCHWGHDYHDVVRYEQGRTFKAGEQLAIRYVMTGYPPQEVARYFDRSEIDPTHAKLEEIGHGYLSTLVPSPYAFPVCDPAGTTFDELQSAREPFTGWHYIGKYTVDNTVGHTDHYSLRLDGPAKVSGQFYHNMIDNYTDNYRVTFWIKTRGVQGKVNAIFKYAYAATPSETHELKVSGDTDWQQITFVSSVPRMTKDNSDSSELIIQLEGAGTLWFDDFSVTPER